MKINNIVFDVKPKIDEKYNKVVIPYPVFGEYLDENQLLDYISTFIKIDKTNLNVKIIQDIEDKINKSKKSKINLSIVIQNKTQYFKIIIMILKFKKQDFNPIELRKSLKKDTIESKIYLGEFYEFFRLLGSTCIVNLNKSEMYKVNICLPNFNKLKVSINNLLESYINFAFIEGLILSMYSFKKYKRKNSPTNENRTYLFNFFSKKKFIELRLNRLFNTIKSFFFTKDLINEPSNKLTPISFIENVKTYIKQNNLPITLIVLDRKQLIKLGMNLLVSVGEGSTKENQSKLLVLIYNPKPQLSKKLK